MRDVTRRHELVERRRQQAALIHIPRLKAFLRFCPLLPKILLDLGPHDTYFSACLGFGIDPKSRLAAVGVTHVRATEMQPPVQGAADQSCLAYSVFSLISDGSVPKKA